MATTLQALSLREHLTAWGIDPSKADVLLADAEYALPAIPWVESDFSSALSVYLQNVVGVYEAEDADCDDYSDAAACYMRWCHRRTLGRPRETAIAFAEFWFVRRDGVGHAINTFVARLGDQLVLRFFEPQLCQLTELTPEEISSCILIKF